ncbi:SIMPL domain-containing protein [Paraburkholderia aspalathi]|uniref:SIMPL domain-containing protein n=1 Tax=Paraburkholderia aspalathi TaxID=1324617 RepID=UPI0038BBBC6B
MKSLPHYPDPRPTSRLARTTHHRRLMIARLPVWCATGVAGIALFWPWLAARANDAQTALPHTDELSLSARASSQLAQDTVDVTMSFEAEARDPASLEQRLNQRTAAAWRIVRSADHVHAHSGAFSVSPTTARDGRISAWRGRTELVLQSDDIAATSTLAGQISSVMQIGNVSFSVSANARNAATAVLTARAIATFRQQALADATALGYSGYVIRQVTVNTGPDDDNDPPAVNPSDTSNGIAPPALQAGSETVTVRVSGSVRMTH